MSAPYYAKGGYFGKVTQQAMVKSGAKGTSTFVLKFKVMSKSDGSAVDQQYDRTAYIYITENTKEMVKENLDVIGFSGKSFRELDPSTPGFFDLTGKDVPMYCGYDTDLENNERERWSISKYGASKDIEGEPVTDYESLDAMFDFTAKPKAAAPKAAKAAAAGTTSTGKPNGSAATVVELTDDELAAKVVELVRSKGNTLAKKSLGVNLLTLKLGRDAIKRAQEDTFLHAYDGAVWKYDGTAITVE